MKVAVVVASRANYGRIKSVLQAIQKHPSLELQLIVGASAMLNRFGRVIDIIRKDGFSIDTSAYILVEGENPITMAKSTGLAIVELSTIFGNLRPDIVLTVADRYETLATAVAASYMNIPVAHTQGGDVSGSIDESVRHAVTKLSHIHFPTTKLSAERLVKMGEDPEMVFCVGCPAIDSITNIDLNVDNLLKRYGGTGVEIDLKKPYLLVIQHPVTTEYEMSLDQINETLQAVEILRMPTLILWPNADAGSDLISKGIRMFREKRPIQDNISFYINFSVEDYARVLNRASCVIGNSSSLLKEGAFFGTPAVNIGHRQLARERGINVIDVNHDSKEIVSAVHRQLKNGHYEKDYLFGDGSAGEKIANILATKKINIQKRLHY